MALLETLKRINWPQAVAGSVLSQCFSLAVHFLMGGGTWSRYLWISLLFAAAVLMGWIIRFTFERIAYKRTVSLYHRIVSRWHEFLGLLNDKAVWTRLFEGGKEVPHVGEIEDALKEMRRELSKYARTKVESHFAEDLFPEGSAPTLKEFVDGQG